LLCLGRKIGLSRAQILQSRPQVNQIPYESEHQFAASYHRDGDKTIVYVKGSPECVLAMCDSSAHEQNRENWNRVATEMARRGLRLLALASGEISFPPSPTKILVRPSRLTFLGFAGLIDPLRPGVREAIRSCQEAGVGIAMITGDHRETAMAIARDLKLINHDDQVLTGPELEHLSVDALLQRLSSVRVFARVTPRQKLQIVEACRKAGHFVAVTGDGVNDAPALHAANIGVAMGRMGTDVAREAADLVLSDDNFASIVAGIEEGRIAYDNIRKVIFLLTSMGAAELVMVLLAVLTGVPVPLLPVQLLWLNLVTDGIQGAALAFEPGEGDTLRRRPRPPLEPIFNRLMIERLLISISVVAFGGFLAYIVALQNGWPVKDARNLLLLVMVLFENFHVLNCRSETKSAFALSPYASPVLLFGTLAALLLHIGGMYLPALRPILSTEAVGYQVWAVAILIAATIVPVMELHKWLWNWRIGRTNHAAY
jgi:Ca2+-transporting ATPase